MGLPSVAHWAIYRRGAARLITVYRTLAFERRAPGLLGPDGVEEFVDFIGANPLSGDVVAGTGGVRKVRWARPGMGKRGGVRILYYYHDDENPIGLLTIYGKGDKDTLTKKRPSRTGDRRAEAADTRSTASEQDQMRKVSMPRNIAREALDGLKELSDHIAGKPTKGVATTVRIPADIDVRALRTRLGLSQEEFSRPMRSQSTR